MPDPSIPTARSTPEQVDADLAVADDWSGPGWQIVRRLAAEVRALRADLKVTDAAAATAEDQLGDLRDGVLTAIVEAGLASAVCEDDPLPYSVGKALKAARAPRSAEPDADHVPGRLDAAADALEVVGAADGPAAADCHRAADDLRSAAHQLRHDAGAYAAVAAALTRPSDTTAEPRTVYGVATGEYDDWEIRALHVDRADAERACDRITAERDHDGAQLEPTADVVELLLLPSGSDDLRIRRWVCLFGYGDTDDRRHHDEHDVLPQDVPETVEVVSTPGEPIVLLAEAGTLERANELLDAALARPPGSAL